MADHPLGQRIADVLGLQPEARAIEYDGRWLSWGEVSEAAWRTASLTAQHSADRQIGMLLRNRPGQVAAFLGVLLGGGTVVTINPSRGDERTRADIGALRLPLVMGEPDDLATLVPPETPTVAISGLLDDAGGPSRHGGGPAPRPGVAVRMLTSGTTGPPKRIDLSYDMLARSVMGPDPDHAPAPTQLRRGVAIVNSPLVHIGGVFRVLQCIAEARSFVLLERFELNAWAEAVRRHRPRAVSLVPAALRTVLHSDLSRADLDSIRAVTCGTAPLSADDADAFT
jgi:long-chain acyl-CoA synthetase